MSVNTLINRVLCLEKGMEAHSGILAWRIPWTEKSGGLQSMGSQRVGHDCVVNTLSACCSLYRWPSLVVEKGFLDVFRLTQGAWNSPKLRKGPFSLETGRSRNTAPGGTAFLGVMCT